MTKNQEDYLNMVLTVIAVVNENETIWTKNAVFKVVIDKLQELTNDVVDLQSKQDADNTGIATGKKKKRNALEDDNLMIGNILSFYGSDIGDANLQQQMNFAPSTMGKIAEIKLIGLSKIVQDLGVANLSGASQYGLTQDLLTSQSTHLSDFTKLLNAPRVAQTSVSEATDKIAALLETTHTTIDEKFNKAMMLYRGSDFYIRVQKARIIVDSPTNHLAATAAFTDADGKPPPDVKISIVNGNDKVLRKSSPMGNIRVQNLLAGDHVLVAEKPGYAKVELPFVVSEPDTTRLGVVMKLA